MTKSEKIQSLQEIWCKIVGMDHHKNCDIQHWMSIRYSYGDVEYRAEHGAYIGESFDKSFNTLIAAQNYLISELSRQIREELNSIMYRCERPDEYYVVKSMDYWNKLDEEFQQINSIIPSDKPDKEINFEEEYWNLKRRYEIIKYDIDLITDLLDKNDIIKYDKNYPEMEYSVNYRVELLINKLKYEK